MTTPSLQKTDDEELMDAMTALLRAAHDARVNAVRTNTDIAVMRDGKIIRITPDELRQMGFKQLFTMAVANAPPKKARL